MMDLLFIALMQSAAGDPAPAQPPQPQTEAPATEQPRTIRRDQTVVLVPDDPAFDGVRCERTAATGSRVRRETVCTTAQTRTEAREAATAIANSGGRNPNRGD